MARDNSLPLRRAVLAWLKLDPGVTALVPAASIHPQAPRFVPTWPFIRFGVALGAPRRASCVDGSLVNFSAHAFAKDRVVGGETVETAEDHAHRIGAAMAKLGGRSLDLDTDHPARAAIRWTGSRVIQDGDDPAGFHAIVDFEARILS